MLYVVCCQKCNKQLGCYYPEYPGKFGNCDDCDNKICEILKKVSYKNTGLCYKCSYTVIGDDEDAAINLSL